MDAVERASEMMTIPIGKLPYSAVMYAKYGMCGEVLLTAYAGYVQKVENSTCNDDLYVVSDKEWDDFLRNLK